MGSVNSKADIQALVAQKDLFIFDLDGTLFNTLGDLAPAVNFAMRKFGLKEHDNETVRSFIGNGSMNLIRRAVSNALGLGWPKLESMTIGDIDIAQVHQVYSQFYWENCTAHTVPYEGVVEFIERLRSQAKRVAMVTNKPVKPSEIILQKFNLLKHFDAYLCGDTSPERKPSPAGIQAILKQLGTDPKKALMIGDDTPDVMASKNAGIDCVALLEGFGKPENLLPLKPPYTIGHIKDFPY